jgi:hypothetical protein
MKVLTTLLIATAAAGVFPGPGRSWSPDRRYSIVWKEATSETEEHSLLLERKGSGASTILYTFPRGVDVLWAPDSHHVAITDAHGSNESFVVILGIGGIGTRIVIDPERVQEATSLAGNRDHHVYVEGVRWLSSQKLLLRVHGYGDLHPKGFTRRLVFGISGQSITPAPPGT